MMPYWFVGSSFAAKHDQTERFIEDGIWENGYDDRYIDVVQMMVPGERIAIKATHTRKHDLPFDNRGHHVSIMNIKATGTILANLDDGKYLQVDWTPTEPGRDWYFYTYRRTIWRVEPGKWMTDALIDFAFEGRAQDIDRFREQPYWRDRFGNVSEFGGASFSAAA